MTDRYEPISLIGKGNFGSITKIRRKSDGKILVWKELNYGSMKEKYKHHISSEINILTEQLKKNKNKTIQNNINYNISNKNEIKEEEEPKSKEKKKKEIKFIKFKRVRETKLEKKNK